MTAAVLQVPALSVRPPWAQLILGRWKPCENRTWTTTYRGPLVIHSGKTWEQSGADLALALGVPAWAIPARRSVRSSYLGVVDLTDIHPAAGCNGGCGAWGEPGDDVFHWVVKSPCSFAQPIPGPGRLGLYRKGIPDEVYQAVHEVMAA